MRTTILGLDIGTTITKAVLFDLAGQELAVVEQTLKLHTPRPGWVELDPAELWEATLHVLRAIGHLPLPDVRIRAVVLSTQGGSLIPLGADGLPSYNAITWLDHRSEGIVADWRAQALDQRIRQISGWAPQPGLPLATICALRQMHPEVYAATHRYLSVNDYLTFNLTGRFCMNPSMAGEMLLSDIQSGHWNRELGDLAGISFDQLSPITPSDSSCGEIRPQICEWTGLEKGTPVINGGQDHSCEALALGMRSPGSYLLACGTAWVINGVTDSPSVDEIPPEMALNPHVIPNRWIASQFLGGLGAGMEWWLNQFWSPLPAEKSASRGERYAAFNAALGQTSPGSSGLLFHPVTGTPRSGANSGGYAGLRLHHTRADMGRAVLESAAYEVRAAVANIQKTGLPLKHMWMVGGATRSPVWPQILADVVGIPISLTQYSHGPALGAAMLAAKGLGLLDEYPTWVSAENVAPNPVNTQIYDECYATYERAIERYSS